MTDPMAQAERTVELTDAYETASQHWRQLAGGVQSAVTAHAKRPDRPRFDTEGAVRTKARRPRPEPQPAAA
ncbi:hypothetical protein ABZT02_37735 [Streptomyces sp. NPDC005402]|uniref:hypothetical protein n=1 Tax=Streptomyces sp. NPDC005402 TaxID=3155338 RepID=UPI0033AB8890